MLHAYIGIGIGIATFFVATVLAYKERKEGDADWKWALALAFFGLASSADSVVQGLAADKAAEASEIRENELLGINRAIAAKLQSRAELVTPEVRARLLADLGKLPEKSVRIVTLNDTPESGDLANVLIGILKESDRFADSRDVDVLGEGSRPAGKIVIQALDGELAETGRSALVDAGFSDVVIDPNAPEFTGGNAKVQITIRPR